MLQLRTTFLVGLLLTGPVTLFGEAQLASLQQRHYEARRGTGATPLNISVDDFRTISAATERQVVVLNDKHIGHKWRFGIVVDTEAQTVGIVAPLSAPSGDYDLLVTASTDNRPKATATISVTVTPAQVLSTSIPVVLLNGFQLVGFLTTCPTTKAADTFGQLPALLTKYSISWFYFDNCIECPNCSIEDLGATLSYVLQNTTYPDTTPVPTFDAIAHSMGGLILRCYLSGKQNAHGIFNPPIPALIRKAVFIGTPHFGSFQAPSLPFSRQAKEMSPGSQFLFDLAMWNKRGDDLRGVDAISIVGNAGTNFSLEPGDGVVDTTSASLRFVRWGLEFDRTRIINRCHIDSSTLAGSFIPCNGDGIAFVDSERHPTWQIIYAFLNGSDTWRVIGNNPAQDPYLTNSVGVIFTALDQYGASQHLYSAGLYDWSVVLNKGQDDTLFFYNYVPTGTSPFLQEYYDGYVNTSDSFSFANWLGGYQAFLVKPVPLIQNVLSPYAGPGWTAASGQQITITGLTLSSGSGAPSVSENQTSLPVMSYSPTQVVTKLLPNVAGGVKLAISNSSGSDTVTIVVAPPPQSAITAVVNSGSQASGAVSPGEIITIYGIGLGPSSAVFGAASAGSFSTSLGGVQVLVGGKLCALLYVSQFQVNAMVPFEITNPSVAVSVQYQGTQTAPVWVNVVQATPGIFPGAVLNQDYSVNNSAHPAARGSVIQVFATGGGVLNGSCQTGKIAPGVCYLGVPVSATVGGYSAPVLYAGTSPGLISGVLQVNIQIPTAVAVGTTVPITITAGDLTTQPGVVTSVR